MTGYIINGMPRRGSPLEEKPCRQCTSFSEYLKENKERLKAEGKDESELKCVRI